MYNLILTLRVNKQFWFLHEQGEITRKQLFKERFPVFFKEIHLEKEVDFQALDDEYRYFLSQSYELMPEALETLVELKEKGYEMYIVTNGATEVSRPRIEHSGLAPFFHQIFVSEELGANKPDKAFFESVFQQVKDSDKKEFVIIGDSLTSDILGGKNAGIGTIWYNPTEQKRDKALLPDVEIHRLSEISIFLNKWD